ncbi:unnamed protein product, partial [Mesorhabditis spiculigera]
MMCKAEGKCLPARKICDGVNDCTDGSDEQLEKLARDNGVLIVYSFFGFLIGFGSGGFVLFILSMSMRRCIYYHWYRAVKKRRELVDELRSSGKERPAVVQQGPPMVMNGSDEASRRPMPMDPPAISVAKPTEQILPSVPQENPQVSKKGPIGRFFDRFHHTSAPAAQPSNMQVPIFSKK